jgi:hypothetical protein
VLSSFDRATDSPAAPLLIFMLPKKH